MTKPVPRVAAPCKCGLHQIPGWADQVSWFWQLHSRNVCTLELPNSRCECGLLRSEHIEGHAESMPEFGASDSSTLLKREN